MPVNHTFTRQKQREQRIAIESIDRKIGLPVKYALMPLTLLAVWILEPQAFSQVSFYAGFGVYIVGTALLTVLYRRPIKRAFRLALFCVWIEEIYLALLATHTGASTYAQVVILMVLSAMPVLKAGLLAITHREYLTIACTGSAVFLGGIICLEPIHVRFIHFWWAFLASWGIIGTGQVILDSLLRQREKRLISYARQGELFRKLLSAQEEERKRIARELHDETSQAMAVLMVHIETAEMMLPTPSSGADEVKRKLMETRTLAAETMDALHRISFDLRPILLDDLGLIPAIREYARTYKKQVGLTVHCEFKGVDRRLPSDLEVVLFRVIQEALTNVVKHARAKTVDISLTRREDLVTAVVQDDGCGFDTTCVSENGQQDRCLGINGMKERVALAGGVFAIASHAGEGTRITIELPADGKEGYDA